MDTLQETRGRKPLYTEPMKDYSISLPVPEYEELRAMSERTDVPIARLLRKAVHEWLERQRIDADLARAHAQNHPKL